MPKSKNQSKSSTNTKPYSKTNTPSSQSNSKSNSNDTKSSSSALDEIETLFATKKLQAKQTQQQIQQQQELDRIERQRRKEAKADEEADEWKLRGASSATASTAGASRKGEAVAPAAYHAQAVQLKLTYTRSDLVQLNNSSSTNNNNNNSKSSKNHNEKWASDGLGGIFNTEGYTGRKDEGGHRVFKAHLMNREGFGMSPDCPFDCDCCYI